MRVIFHSRNKRSFRKCGTMHRKFKNWVHYEPFCSSPNQTASDCPDFVQIMSVLHLPLCTSGASLGYTALPSSVRPMQSSNMKSNTGMYYISYQVYCRGHVVLQEHPSGVLHFAIKCIVETIMYSTSGAPLRCTAFAIKCTAYPIIFFRSLAWV